VIQNKASTVIDNSQNIAHIRSPRWIHPRGLSREEAARYVGISPSLFDQMVKDGRMPKPIRINTRTVWDRTKVDAAFDALAEDDDAQVNPWDAEVA
jgi:predicted DNA-binding transcriptional regulator AlpA